jgi:protein-L-isoaspartate(D-aspartate) O-methyltransferase
MDKKDLLEKLRQEGFSNFIITAFDKVKRESFVYENQKIYAYEDQALPIGYGQTISQPTTIAFMLELLDLEEGDNLKILEIGFGSGYVLELLKVLSPNSKIFGTERIKELFDKAKERINNSRISLKYTPESLGIIDISPFDRILVSASSNFLPTILLGQLSNLGIMVCPIKNSIFRVKKLDGKLKIDEHKGFSFVPLII